MPVEIIPVTDRASWLAMRQRDVTASAAGALLGVHDYITAYGLWALKSGRISEDPEETPPMRRGRLLEPVAVELLREERPDWALSLPGVYLRDPAARLGATPDLFAVCPDLGRGIVQIKTVEPSVFRRKWRDAETGEVSPPLWIAVQAIVEAHLARREWAAVAAMTVAFGVELHVVPVPIHPGVIDRVRAAVAEFWRLVESGAAPDPDYARDGETIARLFASDDGSEIDLSRDNRAPELLDERERLSAEKAAADRRLKEIKAELLAKVGAASVARLADGRTITAKTVNRKAYTVAPSSYRDVRVRAAANLEAAE